MDLQGELEASRAAVAPAEESPKAVQAEPEAGGKRRRSGTVILPPHVQPDREWRLRKNPYGNVDETDLSQLSEEEQRYIDLRVSGETASGSMRKLDLESDRRRTYNASKLAAGKMEKKVGRIIQSISRADEMTDTQFDAWQRERVQFAIAHDEAGIAGKLSALKYLQELRERKKYSNPQKLIESLARATERITELQSIERLGATRGVDGACVGGDGIADGKNGGISGVTTAPSGENP